MTTKLVTSIAKQVKSALKQAGATETATLTRSTPGTRTPGDLAAGTNPTTVDYTGTGLVSTETYDKIGGTLVQKLDRVVVLFGFSVRPGTRDTVTIDGKTQKVFDVQGSPAAWTCLCRGPVT